MGRHLEVNFHGARRLGELCAPSMLAAGEGAIAQVVSSAGLAGYAYVSAYCASKHALLGYSRALADELGPRGVRVSCVCPHYVDSPMLRASIERVMAKTGQSEAEARAFFVGQNPGGALVTTEQVAATVAELLADEDGGRVVELDGGPAKEIA